MSDAQGVNNYHGPVFNAGSSGNQFAWNNGTVTQNQQHNTAVAPGYEELASVVGNLLGELPRAGLGETERAETEAAARGVLAEITGADAPEEGRLRSALGRLDGSLAPVATGVVAGVAVGAQEWARAAIEALAGLV
ncbi:MULTISPECIES: hypothetical protein [Streptomyces]|uniref:Uncharacterized protein n=1 Tax=Streptomyces tsukubensis (strain DSM 42081 / NBRC 108919 / NRRL 18488 / 9993) TaxID=1114943 RepID=I2MZZ2_STRT9|nr:MULTISPECIES: hypothetical protein [Streptomyces]AZK94580.1 hypothetical protein B7R87_12445 [Streptomyces tsukubensis]EIF90339.1 hypothetical protein [Streptomyces tsukubensis NRRL18488]MYS67506.1 hypothetical protein [Streptomyces sp. SID5473]QKM69333.1 hypothetical protein STSU_021325 [Streptomyces tsukubensis NRRL18488]TAI42735.1 hypothetical protein EWI31_20210 [Streptomyces tsukubensis]